jgi:tetratricopeptide (TPR) repeat protein
MYNLGLAWQTKGNTSEAIACFRKTIEINPKYMGAHDDLVAVLKQESRLDQAIADYQKTLELDPQNAAARCGLAVALGASGQLDNAIDAYRRAIDYDPKVSWLHSHLGDVLRDRGEITEAIVSYREAVRIFTDSFVARVGLANILFKEARYLEALPHYKQAIAARPTEANLYEAACCAALAAAGKDSSSGALDPLEAAAWRKMALCWLRADLKRRARQLDGGQPDSRIAAHQPLAAWQDDANLASLREAAAVAQLPADEQAACQKLWADVAALVQKSAPPTAPAP